MPNSNSKKLKAASKTVRTKRTVIEGDDGWAHVVGGRTIKADTTKTKSKSRIDGIDVASHTLAEVKVEFENSKKKWEESDACKELIKLLQPYKGLNQIKNVVIMGLGSFQYQRSTQMQFAALMTIIATLDISSIPVTAQDPVFTSLDKEFLQTHDMSVIEDPDGFDLVDANTLVYAIHCYPTVYQQVGKKGGPAVLIGNDLKGRTTGPIDFKEKFPDFDSWYENLESLFPMPQFRTHFSDTIWYCSKTFTLD